MKSLHITTPTVKQSLPQMHDQQGWEQFLKHTIMDSSVPSVTSPDPSVMLEGTMRSLTKKRSPQPGLVNALKSMSLESGLPWKQIANHLFHSSLQQTFPRCPTRILRFRLLMMRHDPEVLHVPGKCQISADALSRAPVNSLNTSDIQFTEEVKALASSTVDHVPATAQGLQGIIEAQRNDEVCVQVRGYCQAGYQHTCPINPYSGHIGKAELT